ncbi:MAG: ABC transporter ATP-binding protein [Methylococcales bacterium]
MRWAVSRRQRHCRSARLDGVELLGQPPAFWHGLRGRKLGWMTQGVATAFEPNGRIVSQMTPVLHRLRGWRPEQTKETLKDRLRYFGIDNGAELLTRRWSELSGGQQRLVLASVWLCVGPEMLFLDEPSVGLDSARSTLLAKALRATRDLIGLTALVVSHDWRFAHEIADRCLHLNEGAITPLAPGDPNETTPLAKPMARTGADDAVLVVRGLSKRYRQGSTAVEVLRQLSFTVYARRVLVLWGRSGIGKTTAARCALRLQEPDSGEIVFRGSDLRQLDAPALRAMRRRMQVVEQDAYSTVDPKWRVRDAVMEGVRLHGLQVKTHKDKLRYWMTSLGLPLSLLERFCGDLSVGEAQRVAIIRALILEPDILVLDEPSANLDRASRKNLIECIRNYLVRVGGGSC